MMKNFIDIINEAQRLDETQRSWQEPGAEAKGDHEQRFILGALLRGQFRKILDKAKFEHHVTEYHETKEFLESEFIVRAPAVTIRALTNLVQGWVNQTA